MPKHPEPEADRELISTRILQAPRALVWRAWTEPVHLAAWWGPKGFSNTVHEFDLRPGGHWRFVMYGPTGTAYPNQSVFVEVVRPERLVFDHVSNPPFRVTATFAEVASNRTKVSFRMLFESVAECAKLKAVCLAANEENFDRLEAQLARIS